MEETRVGLGQGGENRGCGQLEAAPLVCKLAWLVAVTLEWLLYVPRVHGVMTGLRGVPSPLSQAPSPDDLFPDSVRYLRDHAGLHDQGQPRTPSLLQQGVAGRHQW